MLAAHCDENALDYEIIAVNDGSTDSTAQVLENIQIEKFRYINRTQNEGKFASISAGVTSAEGDCIAFTDSDLPYDLTAFNYASSLISGGGVHIVVGDRTLSGSKYDNELPFFRKLATKTLRALVRLVSLGGIHDSQCGFKAVEKSIAQRIFPLLQERRFAGDIELLYIALKYNLSIRRIPVRLRRSQDSSVRTFWTSIEILKCLCKLKIRHLLGTYDDKELENLSRQFYWL